VGAPLRPGAIRVDDVWRRYRLTRERNMTLKETLLRRRRVVGEDFWALRGVSFEIEPGTALGLIGVNGSGKSTLLKIVAGILGPSAGSVQSAGTMASLLDLGSGFSQEFTGRENAMLNASLLGLPKRLVHERMDEIIEFSELGPFIDQPVRTYSTGMALRLAFSIAVTVEAQILLLDEVLAVGDEAFQRKCLGKMYDRRATDSTIVFVSHDMAAVELICDRVILLQRGEKVADGDPADVIGQYHEALAGVVTGPSRQAEVADAEDPEEPAGPEEIASPGGRRMPRARSWGSGRVVVSGVRMLNAEEAETERFLGGSAMRVEIDYEFREPDVEDPKVTVRVSQLDGDVLFDVNSVIDDFDAPLRRPSGTVVLTIPSLPLQQGRFLLTVGLSTKRETEVYHLLERWMEFSVFAPRRQDGILAVDREWSLASDGRPGVAAPIARS
jgi:ABC-type polysaccharide/polyol phosphate transport system ATPase subunit